MTNISIAVYNIAKVTFISISAVYLIKHVIIAQVNRNDNVIITPFVTLSITDSSFL